MRAAAKTWLTAVLFPVVVAACSQATAAGPPSPGAPVSARQAELEAIYHARTDSARRGFTEADVTFMTGMIHHHSQAITISELVPDRTDRPEMRTLAARIINSQRDEIATMERWLRSRDQPVPAMAGGGGQAMDHGDHARMHMPGMLSAEQIRELEAARGAAFDSLFLTRMIYHHQGAVEMVHELFATDGAAQDEDVFRFASDVQVDQITEVARMEQMLARMAGNRTPR